MKFKFAKITNSRLMGSMGLVIGWRVNNDEVFQYFLLDAEGLGIADYISLKNPTKEDAYKEEERLMGGLGSDKIKISKEEALFLVNDFGKKTKLYEKELPGNVDEYIDIIERDDFNLNIFDIYPKICKKVTSEVEFINYMTMRLIAWDRESLRYFSKSEEISNMHVTSINGTLLKNHVINVEKGKYISHALYEDEDGYYTCKVALFIEDNEDNYKIKSMLVADIKPMYDFEVFDEISKGEYVDIYNLENEDKFVEDFYNKNPFLLRSDMDEGVFFTRFNFNNEHVKKETYVINNDIKAIYYILDNKLYVGTYSEKEKLYINKLLQVNFERDLEKADEYYFEENALYDFVESGSNDFEDFLDN